MSADPDRLPALIFDDGTTLRERAIEAARQWQKDHQATENVSTDPLKSWEPSLTYQVITDLLVALLSSKS